MAYYDSEEIYDLEQEIMKLKQENANLRKQIKDKEARIMELDRVEREKQGIVGRSELGVEKKDGGKCILKKP